MIDLQEALALGFGVALVIAPLSGLLVLVGPYIMLALGYLGLFVVYAIYFAWLGMRWTWRKLV